MNFFCTKKHYEEWAETMGIDAEGTYCLDARAALAAARELFGE